MNGKLPMAKMAQMKSNDFRLHRASFELITRSTWDDTVKYESESLIEMVKNFAANSYGGWPKSCSK